MKKDLKELILRIARDPENACKKDGEFVFDSVAYKIYYVDANQNYVKEIDFVMM